MLTVLYDFYITYKKIQNGKCNSCFLLLSKQKNPENIADLELELKY